MEHLTFFLLYSLRFSAILVVVMLWTVAMSSIGGHARQGLCTSAELAFVVVAVSVVAVGAVAALNAVVPTRAWTETGPREGAGVPPPERECDAFSYTFTYSFGLRRPTLPSQDCTMRPAENLRTPYAARQGSVAPGDKG